MSGVSYGKKDESRETRGSEDGHVIQPDHPDRETGTRTASDGIGDLSGGIVGTDREGHITRLLFVVGGILSQLITDAEDHLAKMEECVSWYQDEATTARQRLDRLKSLQQAKSE